MNAGQTVTLTYTGTVKGTFPVTPPPGCAPGQYPVVNTVTITNTNGAGSSATLCVNAAAVLRADKTVFPKTATIGQTVDYTIVITNSGAADGVTNIVDDYDQAHLTISAISPGGSDDGDKITWNNVVCAKNWIIFMTMNLPTRTSLKNN